MLTLSQRKDTDEKSLPSGLDCQFYPRPKRKIILSPFCTLVPSPLSSVATG